MLDTNIIVDIVSKRGGYEESLQILRFCEARRVGGFVSAITVTDVMYILRGHAASGSIREAMRTLLAIVDVEGVLRGDIAAAFKSEMGDFEDAVQASCAARVHADYIVTRNCKDFSDSGVPAILPGDALKLLQGA
jgi:predicted nucleic acid-binding protein